MTQAITCKKCGFRTRRAYDLSREIGGPYGYCGECQAYDMGHSEERWEDLVDDDVVVPIITNQETWKEIENNDDYIVYECPIDANHVLIEFKNHSWTLSGYPKQSIIKLAKIFADEYKLFGGS